MGNLTIEDHGQGGYLYIIRGEIAVNLDTKIGTRQYLHISALKNPILANMSDGKFDHVLDKNGLPPETPNTVTDPEFLKMELEKIRERDTTFDGEERAEASDASPHPSPTRSRLSAQ